MNNSSNSDFDGSEDVYGEGAPGESHPFRGEEVGGATASICAGFAPEPLRFVCYQPAMKILGIFGIIVAVLMVGSFAAGYAIRIPGGLWPGLMAFLFYAVGIVLAIIWLLDLAFFIMFYASAAHQFKNSLLTPGVVVSEKPLAVVGLAPLGNGSGTSYSGLQRLELSGLPYHPHTSGTRLPLVSCFQPAEGLDRWLSFVPEPISWGTGRKANIDQCFARLGTEDFERLEACIRKGLVPENDDELILLDENDNKLQSFSIKEEKKKYGLAGN